MSNYKFETLQLHVGQEQADPAPTPVPFPFTRPLPMYSATPPTPLPGSVWRMLATSMAV